MEAKALFIVATILLLSVAGIRGANSTRVEVFLSLVILVSLWSGLFYGSRLLESQGRTKLVAYHGEIYKVVERRKLLKIESEGGQRIIVPAAMTKKVC
jgi:hypothetical protein